MKVRSLISVSAALIAAACATAELTESGVLSSYSNLETRNGVLTKSRVRAEKDAVLAARTAFLKPTIVAGGTVASGLTSQELRRVSNAVDRAVCRDLSRRFVMVEAGQPSDLVVHIAITHVEKTDATAAGASVVAGVGSTVAGAVTGVPIPSVRIPVGLGSLTVEGEAKDPSGRQLAALVWARGADAFTTKARVANEADAHTLAGEFANDFAKLLIRGTDPITDLTPLAPTTESVGEYFGSDAKYAACRQFGRHPGLGNTIGGALGMPPDWTDKGPVQP
jgi:hypothetical protein